MLHQHSQNAGSGLTVPTMMEMGHPQTAHTTREFASICPALLGNHTPAIQLQGSVAYCQTCSQRFCFVMCSLDMKGLVGAATVVGSLQHGAGI